MIECMKNMAKRPEFGRWIPVSERLPEDTEQNGYLLNYLACDKDGIIDIGNYIPQIGWFSLGMPMRDVTAWMPLPEPYRESEE